MKVALIGDVHANLPALEAVLEHARRRNVNAIWNVGDLVGYGAFPNQVIGWLRREGVVSIVGNYDLDVLTVKNKSKRWRKKKQLQKLLSFQWTLDVLTTKNRKYLRSLPKERRLSVDNLDVLLTHASPASDQEHLTPDTPQERLLALASVAEADLVVCGHSHRPFVREAGGACFINTGSVGRPDDGDPRACYAILQTGPGSAQHPQVRHCRVVYDVGSAVAAIREQGLPEAFAQMMMQGYALDRVMAAPHTWISVPVRPLSWSESETERRLAAVRGLAESFAHEDEHSRHVTWLSLRLFDELEPLHRLGQEDRFWLQSAALLHDIGWVDGQKGHHKASMSYILNQLGGPFDQRERLIVASVARYHRGALPKDKHDHFAALSPVDQYRVTILAALLRIADGLDCGHAGLVQNVSCEISPDRIRIGCAAPVWPLAEREEALEKADLLERVFDRKVLVEPTEG